ncbi:Cytochrome P450 [Macrophomina phaseolina MS6]|uniref:Cytochrome P450 n=1 Tax=Macrophomina phaseolina (strain MS6) TaxID=1126212 RepID=K2SB28_MACPH|nr:Cytochrome P450 [Macrophomina phaseolina MS6]
MAEAGLFYIDLWPVAPAMLAVFDPDMMAQFTQETSLPKHEMMRREFFPFTGCNDLVNQEGQEWKAWRSIFNPGFSVKNITALVPAFLEEIQVFKDWLISIAETGEVVEMEGPAMKAAMDVIGRAILDCRLHCQTEELPFYKALKDQVSWMLFDGMPRTLLKQANPFRRLIIWNNNRIMKNFLKPHIEKGVAQYVAGKLDGVKTINSLAVKAYVEQIQSAGSKANMTGVDPHFVDMAIAQLKIFFLAGHDTTATALSCACHLLHKNPHTLAALRAEHDAVFGRDPTTARAQIAANPQLLNQLPYTSAVIKETLRFYPPVGTVRQGQPGFFLTHPESGRRHPTAGFLVLSCSFAEQRMAKYWARAGEFLPERWLVRDERDPLHVRKNAFRSFELGPRGCIGQELAQMELRAILAMTVRELDIESAYADDAPEVLGEKAYQVLVPGELTGHPKGGVPIRVKIRDWQSLA